MTLRSIFVVALLFPATFLRAGGAASTPAAPVLPISCGTEQGETHLARARELDSAADACPQYGACDDPSVRDAAAIRWLDVRVIVHVLRRGDGTEGVSQAVVDATIEQINQDNRVNGTGIQFDVVATRFHDSDNDYCLPACNATSQCKDFYDSLLAVKKRYAESPERQCNVFITCQPESPYGNLWGVGNYPWSLPLGYWGGVWLNAARGVGGGNFVATHELGHSLGLYHTFRGVSEIASCDNPCAEHVGAADNDVRGDLAGDTPPTPQNPDCATPAGADCLGTVWGDTQPENFMGYGPPGCQTRFTPQQIHRMQCWTASALRSWLAAPDAPCERPRETATVGLWHCGEGAGAIVAEAAGGPIGDLVGGAGWGKSGCGSTALVLDGPGQGLRLPPESLPELPAGSIECTFQWDGTPPAAGGSWIFDQSSGNGASNLGLVLASDATLRLHVAGVERLVSTTTLRPQRWYRVAASWDGVRVRLDLDDTRNAETASNAAPNPLDAALWFGCSGGTVAGGEWYGGIDEIRISRGRVGNPALQLVVAPTPAATFADLNLSLPSAGPVRVELFDLAGRRVATVYDGTLTAGNHVVRWNGASAGGWVMKGGVYVARLTAGAASVRRTLVWAP